MRVDEILSKVQFVVDPNTGKKSAVLIDHAIWEELLILLEGVEDLAEVELNDDDQEDAWITRAVNKVCAEVDTSLDPAISAMQRTWLPKEDW